MAKENRKLSLREEYESLQTERRARYLENLLKESILNVLAEQQQTPKAPPVDPNDPTQTPVPPPPPAPGTPPPAPPVPTPPPVPGAPDANAMPPAPASEPAPPSPTDPMSAPAAAPAGPGNEAKASSVTALVDSLNVIRGGKSLTDPEVLSGISTVFKSLLPDQKQELINILDMLSKAVAGNEDQAAPESQGVPAPTMAPPPPPAAPPAPAQAPPPIAPTGI